MPEVEPEVEQNSNLAISVILKALGWKFGLIYHNDTRGEPGERKKSDKMLMARSNLSSTCLPSHKLRASYASVFVSSSKP